MDTEQPPASDAPEPPATGAKSFRLLKVLPSDRLTADRQIEALKAFAAVYESNGSKPVTNGQAGEVAKMAASTIVVTNAFFCDVGLLVRQDAGFVVAPEVTGFLHSLDGLSPETAGEKLWPLLQRQWFVQLLTPRLKLAPMDLTSVYKVLGEAASAGKEHLGRLEVLVDILCAIGLLRREGNQIRLGSSSHTVVAAAPQPSDSGGKPAKTDEDEGGAAGLEKYSLTLDPSTKRRIIIYAPPTVSEAELARIQQWLSFQLIVMNEQPK